MSIRILPLASGSSGNAMIVDLDGHLFEVDMGLRYKRLNEVYASYRPSFVFITHDHNDHTLGFKVTSKHLEVPFFASKTTRDRLASPKVKGLPYHERIMIEEGLWVTLLRTGHDCPGSCGFVFESENHKFGYVTDTGIIKDEEVEFLKGCDVVVIEANHDIDMLKNGPYPYYLKQRILSEYGHLSNADCADVCERLEQSGTRHFLLAHLSRENNTPEIARKTVAEKIGHASLRILKPFDDEEIVLE